MLMVTSGGYMRETARIIANSILNLRQLGLIACDEAENCQLPILGTAVRLCGHEDVALLLGCWMPLILLLQELNSLGATQYVQFVH